MATQKPTLESKRQHEAIMLNGTHTRPKAKQLADGKTASHLTIMGASERILDACKLEKLNNLDKYYEELSNGE